MFPASFVDVPNDTDPPVRDIFRVHTLHFILFVIYEELSWPNTVTRIKGKSCDTSELRSHIQLSCEFASWILMRNSYSDIFPPLFNIFISSRAQRDPPHTMKMYSVICLGVFVKGMNKMKNLFCDARPPTKLQHWHFH